MKIAIMQPYFFPYLGQFQLIHAADRFLLCDDVQYIRHGWINRNRVLKPVEGVWYVTVPISKHDTRTPIRDVRAVPGYEWKKQILKQTDHYRKAPYFKDVHTLMTACFEYDETNIAKLNARYFQLTCDYIGIDFKTELTSEMNFDYSGIQTTDDWAITITGQAGGTQYLNPPGGAALYDKSRFEANGIQLHFIKPLLNPYDQQRAVFEPGLSIIDVMMFNSPAAIRAMLDDYQLL